IHVTLGVGKRGVGLHAKEVMLKLEDLNCKCLNGRDFLVVMQRAIMEENYVKRKVIKDDDERFTSYKVFKESKKAKKELVETKKKKEELVMNLSYFGGSGVGGVITPYVCVGQRRWARRQATNARWIVCACVRIIERGFLSYGGRGVKQKKSSSVVISAKENSGAKEGMIRLVKKSGCEPNWEEFFLVSGLKFDVENSTDYNKAKDPIPFRRRVFSSDLDGRPIRGKDVGLLIETTDDYYTRYRRHPRIVAWSLKHKFYRHMLKPMLHGQLPVERLVPDETEARSRWWVSSRVYFDGRSFEDEQIPQGGPSSFHTLTNNSSFFNMAMPSNWQTPNQSNWLSPSNCQTPNPSYLGTPNSQPPIPSQPGTSNWQNLMICRRQNAGILDPNLCDRARREPQPSVYMLSPYTVLPPTTVLTKKKIDKTKKKGKTKKLSHLNLGNTFADENVSVDDVTITGIQQTDNYFNYETVDPDKVTQYAYVSMTEFLLDPYDIYLDCYMKGYKLPSFFWPQLVPHMCTYRRERSWPEGWLSSDDSWIQILIKEGTQNANWTLANSGTVCLHQENNRFMILTDPHNIRTLDGSVRPFSSWNDVTWVYMPINDGGVHWVTRAINLAESIFYVFDSMESESRILMLEKQVKN
nr:F-box protein At2g27310-like [Tanacetum cinerariifolium]